MDSHKVFVDSPVADVFISLGDQRVTKFDSEFPDTRASLLLKMQVGVDNVAWQEFVSTYRPIIYRLARKRGLQDADAQDLAQQVLISIAGSIERWKKNNESVRFRHWLRIDRDDVHLDTPVPGPGAAVHSR